MFACSGVRGLFHTAAVRADAAFVRQVVGQQLQGNQMDEGRKPLRNFGDHQNFLGG